MMLSWSFVGMLKEVKNGGLITLTFPTRVEQGHILTSCFSSHTINKQPFHCLFSACFCISVLFIGDFVV